MTSRTDLATGFTLIEILIVLVVLGLLVGLVVARGPSRSATLELRDAASQVAQTMREGRTRAIITNRPVLFRLDAARHAYGVVGEPLQALPERVAANLGGVPEGNQAVIRFAPDGSSSGGQVDLVLNHLHMRVAVAWLTGRIDVADAP